MSLDLSSIKSAVGQLDEALMLCSHEPYVDDPVLSRHLRAAAIQAFEYTYALVLKMIMRYMEKTATPHDIKNMAFASLIREASSMGILRSDVRAWGRYRKMRGITSHTYDEEKAREIFEGIPDFLQEARYVLARLQEGKSLGPPD